MILTLLAALALQDLEFTQDGARYRISRGDVYQFENGQWKLLQKLYDPDYYAKNYVSKEGRIYQQADGQLYETKKSFSAGFENGKRIHDLMDLKDGWTSFALQSPKAPTVKDYVALRQRILKGESDFVDNRIDLAALDGRRALKFTSVAKSSDMVCSKTSISTEMMHFRKGDDLWFAASYYAAEGMPQTVVDFETTWVEGHPGPRVYIDEADLARVELKWSANKAEYRQDRRSALKVPRKKWVRLRVHLKLSEKEDGVVQVWQDGVKIIDAKGQNLPLADTVLNILEVGVSANHNATTLYVDVVVMSDKPIKE